MKLITDMLITLILRCTAECMFYSEDHIGLPQSTNILEVKILIQSASLETGNIQHKHTIIVLTDFN